MTTPDQLRAIIDYLQSRVRLVADGERAIDFSTPTSDEMISAGLETAACDRLLASSWWPEMVDDIIETPEFAEPDASPEAVLGYARDVIQESIGKRFTIDG